MGFFASIDIFDKFSEEEYQVRTVGGAIVSLIFSIIGGILFFAEFITFLVPDINRELVIDKKLTDNMNLVNISMTILVQFPCPLLKMSTIDEVGFQLVKYDTVTFRRYTKAGSFLGISPKNKNKSICHPCFDVLSNESCCNSCEELILLHKLENKTVEVDKWPQCNKVDPQNVRLDENCLIKGKLTINKIKGMFIITSARKHGKILPYFNLSHLIYRFRLGPKFPTASTPLDGLTIIQRAQDSMDFEYLLMCTPVIFESNDIVNDKAFEYTAMISQSPSGKKWKKNEPIPPMIFFSYNFSPYTVKIKMSMKSIAGFISSTFGILSGLYAMTAFLDANCCGPRETVLED